ncbi:NAD(P)-dependent oxidoreductase [Dongia sp.]|uniref:NAD(P)-dependent oxidoreductase n=1 Tax=Dongia sp. TaxID=1977262 RepID=UPI0035B30EBA
MKKIERVGLIGAGLMGHGIGKNILAKGYRLSVLAHRNREPVDDLIAKGATEAKSPAELAASCDMVITVVGNSVQMENIVRRADGLLAGIRNGTIVADCTTAQPDSSVVLAAEITAKGGHFVDIPMTRTPKEAEAGKLGLMTGGDKAVLAQINPVLECFADTIVHCGDVGAAHKAKLINNMLSLGYAAVTAEALSAAKKSGVDLNALRQIVSAGGANSVMFQRLAAYQIDGDNTQLRFAVANAQKDVRYFLQMAETLPIPTFVASAVHQLYAMANGSGYGQHYVPEVIDVLTELGDNALARDD